ncbi:UNVERIFIED_ORG: hypothetical protein J2W66_001945 [Agrobacterium larrymoorei]|nr:hypothetical protein [Agrobacterium larrymoorei]
MKPSIEDLDGTVENEVFCMSLGRRLGLDVPAVSKGTAARSITSWSSATIA